ncbi:MAG: hypothetical protein ACRC4W_09085 [Treponemataceae bacterium]
MYIKKKLIFISLFTIFSLSSLLAAGRKENKFAEIDDSITAKNYNQALILIEDLLKRDPQEFDNAQQRVKIILEHRDDFYSLAEDLVDIILKDPTNNDSKLRLLNQLEGSEKDIDENTLAFFEQTRRIAEFTYIRASFERTIRGAIALTERKRYVDAVNYINESFSLNKEDLENYNFSDEKINDIETKVKNVEKQLEAYASLQKSLIVSVGRFNHAVRQNKIDLANSIFTDSVKPAFQSLANICQILASTASYFYTDYNTIGARMDINPSSYLYVMYQFLSGRNQLSLSGILGTIETQWLELSNSMKSTVAKEVEPRWGRIMASIEEKGAFTQPGVHTQAKRILPETERLALLGGKVNDLNRLKSYRYEGIVTHYYPEFSTGMKAYETLSNILLSHLENIEALAVTEKKRSNFSLKGNVATNSYQQSNDFLRLLVQLNNSYRSIASATAKLRTRSLAIPTNYVAERETDVALSLAPKHEYVNTLLNKTIALDTESNKSIWTTFAKYVSSGCDTLLDNHAQSLKKANEFYDGKLNAQTGLMSYFPLESYTEINTTLQKITNDRKNLQVYYKAMDSTDAKTKQDEDFKNDMKIVANTLERLSQINTAGTEIWTNSREKNTIANKEKATGDARYQQAQYNLQIGKFAEARKALQDAREQYNKYLAIQESLAFRNKSDDLLIDLNNKINFAENELVIKDVRRLKNQAKAAYNAEEYDKAEEFLIIAQDRWFTTNIDPDEEILQLLSLIGTALSMRVGRTIPKVAALYPEMSQLFSNANKYFDQGKKLSEANQKKDANQVLQLAKAELHKMQVVYPVNQDASLLLLKIDQLIDPVAFEESFRQKIQTARSNYKVSGRQQSTYLDLLDLYKLNPRYPGLADLIYQVELFLGIRVVPPDRTAQNRSAALTRQANAALNSNDEIVIRSAILQLDEAIKLDSQNEAAFLLKDRLHIKIGGQALAVLSSASEALYQKAVQELQNNNIINAATVLAQLLKDPNSRRSSKVLDLEKRIKILTE